MIEELLAGRRAPGVYDWPVDRREAARGSTEAERSGLRVFRLEGRGVRGKREFLALCAEEFALPSYFGHNWDALADSLRDLSWVPAASGYLVVYDHWRELADADPVAFGTVKDIFESAAAYWRDTPTPLTVLLIVPPEG